MLRAALLSLCLLAVAAPAAGAATVTFSATGATGVTITSEALDTDDVTVTQVSDGYVVSRAGGGLAAAAAPCTGGAGAGAVTCPLAKGISVDLGAGPDRLTTFGVTTPMQIAGGTGADVLNGGAGDDVLAGGVGNDMLTGGGGNDAYFGGDGDDIIEARDGVAERISCGAGDDQARNDFTDILAECERGIDGDGDGFSSAVDCDDANAAIHPGAIDVPEDGIDQDCDGRDALNLDRDHDGFPVPVDCNDANAAIHPGAVEVRGNNVDENCDHKAQPFGLLRALVSTNWQYGTATQVRSLVVRNAPRGAHVSLTCGGPGCPFRGTKKATVKRDLAPVAFQRFFRSARLHAGAEVKVAITATGLVSRTYTYRMQRGDLPAQTTVCRAPGAKKGKAC